MKSIIKGALEAYERKIKKWTHYHVGHAWAIIQEGDDTPLAHVVTEEEAWNLVNTLNYYTRKEFELFAQRN